MRLIVNTWGSTIFGITLFKMYRNPLFADRGVCFEQWSKENFSINWSTCVMRRLILLVGGIPKIAFPFSNNKQFIEETWNACRRWGYQGTIYHIYHLLKCLFIEIVIFPDLISHFTRTQVKMIQYTCESNNRGSIGSQILDFQILESSSLLIWYSCIQFKRASCVPYWTGTIVSTQRRPSPFTMHWDIEYSDPVLVQNGSKIPMRAFHRNIHYTNASVCCEGCTCRSNRRGLPFPCSLCVKIGRIFPNA